VQGQPEPFDATPAVKDSCGRGGLFSDKLLQKLQREREAFSAEADCNEQLYL
jgi:hypothetical protein